MPMTSESLPDFQPLTDVTNSTAPTSAAVHNMTKFDSRKLVPRESVHGCTVKSPLTGCQVTSRPRGRFSRYSK